MYFLIYTFKIIRPGFHLTNVAFKFVFDNFKYLFLSVENYYKLRLGINEDEDFG